MHKGFVVSIPLNVDVSFILEEQKEFVSTRNYFNCMNPAWLFRFQVAWPNLHLSFVQENYARVQLQ